MLCFLWLILPQQAFSAPKIKRVCAARNGVNTVYWNFTVPVDCEITAVQVFARENPTSPFKFIEQKDIDETVNTYEHVNAASFIRGAYYIHFLYKCIDGVTYFDVSDTINVDIAAPPVIQPDSISVGAEGEIFIGWKPSSVADAKSYIVYRTVGNNNFPIDTVYGRQNTSFTDSKQGDAAARAESYKLAPTDSCDNVAPIGNIHQSMFLNVSQDRCAAEVSLKWNPYIGWQKNASENGILRYDVFYSEDKYVGFKKAGSTNAGQFTARGLPNHTQLFFLIRAIQSNDTTVTSSSNRVNLTTLFEDSTQFLYLAKVSHIKNTPKLELTWSVEPTHNYVAFEILRGKAPGILHSAARVNASGQTLYSFTEDIADSNFVWYYQVVGYSNCGRLLGRSNISNSIKLSLDLDVDKRHLSWNTYGNWPTGVQTYELYRTTVSHGKSSETLITQITNGNSFTDAELAESDAVPGVCYFVKAIEAQNNPHGFKEESYSNYTCYADAPFVTIPDAFYPEGIFNKVFKPVTIYADTVASTMVIYNRWGQKITPEMEIWKGWNGKLSGDANAPSGVYFYSMTIYGIDNSQKVYTGTFTLL